MVGISTRPQSFLEHTRELYHYIKKKKMRTTTSDEKRHHTHTPTNTHPHTRDKKVTCKKRYESKYHVRELQKMSHNSMI
jgi:hypothetical protein